MIFDKISSDHILHRFRKRWIEANYAWKENGVLWKTTAQSKMCLWGQQRQWS